MYLENVTSTNGDMPLRSLAPWSEPQAEPASPQQQDIEPASALSAREIESASALSARELVLATLAVLACVVSVTSLVNFVSSVGSIMPPSSPSLKHNASSGHDGIYEPAFQSVELREMREELTSLQREIRRESSERISAIAELYSRLHNVSQTVALLQNQVSKVSGQLDELQQQQHATGQMRSSVCRERSDKKENKGTPDRVAAFDAWQIGAQGQLDEIRERERGYEAAFKRLNVALMKLDGQMRLTSASTSKAITQMNKNVTAALRTAVLLLHQKVAVCNDACPGTVFKTEPEQARSPAAPSPVSKASHDTRVAKTLTRGADSASDPPSSGKESGGGSAMAGRRGLGLDVAADATLALLRASVQPHTIDASDGPLHTTIGQEPVGSSHGHSKRWKERALAWIFPKRKQSQSDTLPTPVNPYPPSAKSRGKESTRPGRPRWAVMLGWAAVIMMLLLIIVCVPGARAAGQAPMARPANI